MYCVNGPAKSISSPGSDVLGDAWDWFGDVSVKFCCSNGGLLSCVPLNWFWWPVEWFSCGCILSGLWVFGLIE